MNTGGFRNWIIWTMLLLATCTSQQHGHFGQKTPAKVYRAVQHRNPIPTPVVTHRINNERDDCRSGFSVRKSLRSNLKAINTIKFEEVLTNAGGWDSKENVFVAPCPGIYFFTFNALSEEGKDFTLALMKNDIYQVTAYGGKKGYQWASNSAVLFLNPEDKVYLELQDGEIYEHPYNEAYTTFTGFLVNKF